MPIRLTVVLPTATPHQTAVPLRFDGASGAWEISARLGTARSLEAVVGGDEVALSRILVLLGGGRLDVGQPPRGLATILVSPSDASGQRWFECARRQML